MAIGTTPLFSKISGSAGPVDYRTRRNGKIEIGKKRIPANPQSTEQTNTRNAYGRLHELWQNAAWIDKTQYENIAAAYDISPWNAFLMRHLPIMRLNPVAYWPFVEGTGNILHDFTANNNHGTIYGSIWERYGYFDIPCLFFDGIDDYVNLNSYTSLRITDAITAESYFDLHTLGSFNPLGGHDSATSGILIRIEATNVVNFYTWGTTPEILGSVSSIKKTGPNHFTFTYDKDAGALNKNFMKNGSIENEDTVTGPMTDPLAAVLRLGSWWGSHWLNGQMMESYFCDYQISTAQNAHLYNISKKFYEK